MTRKSLLIAATLMATAVGAAAANAASFGIAGAAQSQSMIEHVHMGDGPHPHPHPWGPGPGRRFDDHGPRWGNKWGPPQFNRCRIVRAECSDYFRPGSFRWERCLAKRGC